MEPGASLNLNYEELNEIELNGLVGMATLELT